MIADRADVPVYLRIAEKAKHLRELGMSDRAIAVALAVSDKTVAKSVAYVDLAGSQAQAPGSAI